MRTIFFNVLSDFPFLPFEISKLFFAVYMGNLIFTNFY